MPLGGIVWCGVLSSKLTIVRPGHAVSGLADDFADASLQVLIGQPPTGESEVLKQLSARAST